MQQYDPNAGMQQSVPAWTILRIEDAPIIGGPNITARGKRVWFKTALEHQSYIDIAMDQFTPENVARMIDTDVAQLYAVQAMQGPPLPQ